MGKTFADDKCAKEDATRLLCELISAPSVTPTINESKDFKWKFCGESRIAELIRAFAVSKGLESSIVQTKENRQCVIVRVAGTNNPVSKPLFAWFAHLDTVWTPQMQTPFLPRIDGDNISGLGACDDKASICTGLLVAMELTKLKSRNFDFVFAGTADEEAGMIGIKALVPGVLRPDFAIVAEPTSLRPVSAHKGIARWIVETFGTSVHASLVPEGKNAIYSAVRLISAMEGHLAELLAEEAHPLLGRKTINVGTISGGQLPNSVPDHCSFSVERRLLPGESPESAGERIIEKFRKAGVDFKLSPGFSANAFEADAKNAFTMKFLESVREFVPDANFSGIPCATEAAHLSLNGISALVFGPGPLDKAHAVDEFVDVNEIVAARDIMLSFLTEYSG